MHQGSKVLLQTALTQEGSTQGGAGAGGTCPSQAPGHSAGGSSTGAAVTAPQNGKRGQHGATSTTCGGQREPRSCPTILNSRARGGQLKCPGRHRARPSGNMPDDYQKHDSFIFHQHLLIHGPGWPSVTSKRRRDGRAARSMAWSPSVMPFSLRSPSDHALVWCPP